MKLNIYEYLKQKDTYDVLIQLVRNRVINSTSIVVHLNIFEDYLKMNGMKEKDKWDRLSKNYQVSVSTVKRVLTFMKTPIK